MLEPQAASELKKRVLNSLHSTSPVAGLTHNFYRYPGRMPPELAEEIIRNFTRPQDVVLDPFVGGGTTVVEALAAGRRAVGVDLNPLATFISSAKTTPLSYLDRRRLEKWAKNEAFASDSVGTDAKFSIDDPRIKNLPDFIVPVFERALESISALPFPRQQRFARCVLLRLGQWAIDGRTIVAEASAIAEALPKFVDEMFVGLDQLVSIAREHGVQKHQLTGHRTLLLRSAVGLEEDPRIQKSKLRPKLVLTSPPYPAVHVLYHRWQVHGRRETPAPYWLVDAPDGRGASYFTFGGRTPFGVENYFRTLVDAFRSVREIVAPDALIVQLVAFPDVDSQLPTFLAAMERAGFQEQTPIDVSRDDLWRTIPNRKWYCQVGAAHGTSKELLIFHRPVGVT